MKKRLSFLSAVILGLIVVFLIGAIVIWGKGEFNLPDWVTPLASMIAVFLFLEVIGRLGPQKIEPPSIKFMKLSPKDRIVFVVALLALLILAMPIGMSFDSLRIRLLFSGLGFLVYWLILSFFGSKELMQKASKD
jgi:hypothetical protein